MRVYFTRDSVCAADDVHAPHQKQIVIEDGANVQAILTHIYRSGYLPLISGGKATWSVASRIPLAVIAQERAMLKMLSQFEVSMNGLDTQEDLIRIHFSYHAQEDPDVVYNILRELRLTAQ